MDPRERPHGSMIVALLHHDQLGEPEGFVDYFIIDQPVDPARFSERGFLPLLVTTTN